MSELVVLVPVLARPHRVEPLLENIAATTPDARVLFIADPDDLDEQRAIHTAGADLLLIPGTYAQKINAGCRATREPLIFQAADDLLFHDEWLQRACERLSDTVQVVGTNDLGNRRVTSGGHATHNLIDRRYLPRGTVDDPSVLLHEGYHHNFVDDEFVQTAQRRQAWAFAEDSIVEHLHPNWGKADMDNTYEKGFGTFRLDRKRFTRRRALWA